MRTVPHDDYGMLGRCSRSIHPCKHSHLSKPDGTKNVAEKDAIVAIKTRNQLPKQFLEDLQGIFKEKQMSLESFLSMSAIQSEVQEPACGSISWGSHMG